MSTRFSLSGSVTRGVEQPLLEQEQALAQMLDQADAVLIGAGAGLSTAAGFTYSGERFTRYFWDFEQRFGIHDMYSGGFYPFPDDETRWAWWSRNIYYNRYVPAPKPTYRELLSLVRYRDYFVLTTNVDHQFQRAGFDKQRLFYTQGDYGLFQSTNPTLQKTYDNEDWVMAALEAQGFVRDEGGIFQPPVNGRLSTRIPTKLIPTCPDDGSAVTTNLRIDDGFVQDQGWYQASDRYHDFVRRHTGGQMLYLELGVGMNTPAIIKFPFWQATLDNAQARYACVNLGEAYCPVEIADRSLCVSHDIAQVVADLARRLD